MRTCAALSTSLFRGAASAASPESIATGRGVWHTYRHRTATYPPVVMDSGLSPVDCPGMTTACEAIPEINRRESHRRTFSISRRNSRPSFAKASPPKQRAQGRPGAWPTPMAPVREEVHGAGTTGMADASGLPCATVLRLIRALLGDRLFCPRVATTCFRALRSASAPGCQDHTISPSVTAPFVRA